MQRPVGVRALPIIAALVWAIASACGSDSTAPNTSTSALIGTYDLASATFQNQQAIGPPIATGTLVLADSTYIVTLTIPPDTTPVVDSGTYTVSGSNWTQASKVQPVQSVGTYSLSHDTLSVNVTTLNMQVATVWTKQP